MAADYMDKAFPSLAANTIKQRRHHIDNVILPKLGGLAAREVTTADVVALIETVGKNSANVAELATLHRLCDRLDAAGTPVRRFTPHDLRSTARSHLAALGVNVIVAERCLNHSLGGLIAIYDQHDYLTERRAALELWTEFILACEAGKPWKHADNVIPMPRAAA